MQEIVDPRARDMAATARGVAFFVAQSYGHLLRRAHAAEPFSKTEIEMLHLALTPLQAHAEAMDDEMCHSMCALLRAAIPESPSA